MKKLLQITVLALLLLFLTNTKGLHISFQKYEIPPKDSVKIKFENPKYLRYFVESLSNKQKYYTYILNENDYKKFLIDPTVNLEYEFGPKQSTSSGELKFDGKQHVYLVLYNPSFDIIQTSLYATDSEYLWNYFDRIPSWVKDISAILFVVGLLAVSMMFSEYVLRHLEKPKPSINMEPSHQAPPAQN
eukprot:gene11910-5315_t